MNRAQVVAAYRKAAELARGQGVTVTYDPGWTTRGRDGLDPRIIVEHDTSDAARLTRTRMLQILRDGHGALSGNPICNDAVLRDGEVVIVAAGTAWHAGTSSWAGFSALNRWSLGTEYQRATTDPLSGRQLEVGRIWTRARLAAFAIVVGRVAEHGEVATPAGRKRDRSLRPGVRMSGDTWRNQIRAAGTVAPRPQESDVIEWARASWDKLRNRAPRISAGTHDRNVDRQELAFILGELGLLDLLDDPADAKVLFDFARLLRAEGSSGYVARELVRHLRDHPVGSGGGGVTDTDARSIARAVARDELSRATVSPG